jgi:RNA polymerase sigma factor (sigma-70 family)
MLERHDLDDETLIRLVKEGDSDAAGELYERHLATVHRFLYARLDNRMDAEDYSEEVFIRVFNSLHNYNDRGTPFRAYLLTVARNVLIDHYRRNALNALRSECTSDLTPIRREIEYKLETPGAKKPRRITRRLSGGLVHRFERFVSQ